MTPHKTIFWFGIYLLLLGLTIAFLPRLAAAILLLPPPTDFYVIVVGMLLALLGFYYIQNGRTENIAFAQVTVLGRIGIGIVLVGFMFAARVPVNILPIILGDWVGALWTAWALRKAG